MTEQAPLTDAQKAAAVNNYIAHSHCTENWHRHFTGLLVYTDGIKLVADVCGAHWLIDAVASHQTTPKVRNEWFQVWRLLPRYSPDGSLDHWILDCWDDSPEYPGGEGGPPSKCLASQRIEMSDFPEDLAPARRDVGGKSVPIDPGEAGFQFWVERGTALLKCEH